MSHRSDTLPVPSGQRRGQIPRDHSICTQLLEITLHLQQAMTEHFVQLTSRQGLSLEERRHTEAICAHEALLSRLICRMINLLQSGAASGLELQVPLPSEDSRGNVRYGRRAQLSGQPDPVPQLSDCEAAFVSRDLSHSGIDISVFYQSSFQDYNAYQKDKYRKDKNTLGFINLGTSENKLCMDLMTERLQESDMNCIEDTLLQYPDWRGQPFLREEVARFLTYYCRAPTRLDPENVVVLNGCCSVFSALAMVLCDPGEAFLVPAPFYGGFAFSSRLYAKVELIPVHLESEVTVTNTHPFQLTVDQLEETLLEARLERKKVRGLVLINPQNPLGDIYSPDSLMKYLEFAKRYNLHVIIDEIYMLSVFDESITFHSVLSMKSLPDRNRTHVIWGTSKDFGISGFRFGALYTHNKEVASAVSAFGYLHSISGIAQHKLCQLLQNTEWIDKVYLPTNCYRLREAHEYITAELKALEIPFHNCSSGLYVWINLKKYLDPCTFEEERLLYCRFLDNKLLLSRGKTYMCKEPGWFRLIFADELPRLKLAMRRFCDVLQEQKEALIVKQLEDAMRE
ncbi:probable inactive 1-aminocyclopropane-1-carboxylate synthase-like protein 2 [Hylobates moloch]|uniref:probable inactive 1-aminocyclopropane-1-carboxylate synthase-like protein 2 n=1 Tax=Hylobates moloch TaxID=81572 RepID=UPI001362ECC4|nr:probable inactive 1-aminocyclopropane-1-carboxylate synthase-like protein 2 [Hylobates moloch]XP_058302840.1 probable inactive 1-aminocyclopropane-1-carboxylate synthase-like protein 2 [Hylobates moloch]XP_058302841.1 probable inactive 1-aminocyclopropane-1-carboxylate synthase-like protein 2 [Hylobates moloch]XP_058302842.1 probable inactive 1-aminocyclopropane-1-carboxylate synthase-like protein 2 [Hylobates moloch]